MRSREKNHPVPALAVWLILIGSGLVAGLTGFVIAAVSLLVGMLGVLFNALWRSGVSLSDLGGDDA